MSARLARMVLRVDRGLHGTLDSIAVRLRNETGSAYSLAAIVRGLIAIGLATVAGNDVLAPLFAGTKVARGRKPGDRRVAITAPDELEHEDEREDAPTG